MQQTSILFIINPKSGGTKARADVPALLHQFLDKAVFNYSITETEYAGHATELAHEAAAKGTQVVCAVGGDGTVNEVARGLLHSPTALAILPRGSGNGLARHLGIPMHIPKAIQILNRNQHSLIDSGTINSHPFFCTAGIGFDAHVSAVFAQSVKRGLSTYVQLVLREFFSFKPQSAVLQLNGQEVKTECFVVAFANAAQYGNNAYIAPMADIRDGLLDVCLVRDLNIFKALTLSYAVITKVEANPRDAQYFKTRHIRVTSQQPFKYHADGEFIGAATSFEVHISPLSLNVVMP